MNKLKQLLYMLWLKLTGKPAAEELGFMCCFCNESITSLDPDPSDINVIANIDKPKDQQADQYFYCHLQCLKNKLHKNTLEHFVLDDPSKQKSR